MSDNPSDERFNQAVKQVEANTVSLYPLWMQNWAVNLGNARHGRSLDKIFSQPPCERVLVVGRGPSLRKNIDVLAEKGFKGTIVSSDGALPLLQDRGVSPQFSVTVDGSPLIAKWYDAENDGRCRAILPVTAHPSVFNKCIRNAYSVHWYIPELDSENFKGATVLLQLQTVGEANPTGVSRMNGAGNCGLAAIVFSYSILRAKQIVLIGMDGGYPPDTPLSELHYHDNIFKACGMDPAAAAQLYKVLYVPSMGQYCIVDPVFEVYRKTFSMLAKQLSQEGVRITNSTEGGCLVEEGVQVERLATILATSL